MDSSKQAVHPARTLDHVFLAVAVAAYVGFRLWHLTSNPLDTDEVFSIRAAERSLTGLMATVVADKVHPPLYYLALKVWIAIGGTSTVWLRLLSVTFSIATLWPVARLARECGLRTKGIALTVALMAPNQYLVMYAQDIRMYSLLTLLSAASVAALLHLLRNPADRKRWAIAGAVAIGLVYTQYYGWTLLAGEWLVVVIWHRRLALKFTSVGLIVVLTYLPWLEVLRHAVAASGMTEHLAWMTRPTLTDIVALFAKLGGDLDIRHGTSGVAIAFIGLVAIGIAIHGQFARSVPLQLLMCVFVPMAIAFVASYLLATSAWAPRGLIVVAVPFYVATAAAIVYLPRRIAIVAASALLSVALISGVTLGWNGFGKLRWDVIATSILQRGKDPQPTVYALDSYAAAPTSYLLARYPKVRVLVLGAQDSLPSKRNYWLIFRARSSGAAARLVTSAEARGCIPKLTAKTAAGDDFAQGVYVVCRPDAAAE